MLTDLNAEAARRVGIADKIVIPNPRADQAHQRFDYLRIRARQKADRGTMSALVVGPSQTGKSTILHSYRRRLNTPDAIGDGRIPVLMVTLTANQTRKGMAQDILRRVEKFGYRTLWDKGTENQLLDRVQAIIQERQVELLVLDEFQHLVGSDDQKVASSVSDTVKWLLMESVVPVVMSGVEAAWLPLKANPQLANRCPSPIILSPLDLTDPADELLFGSFLASFMVELERLELIGNATDVLTDPLVFPALAEVSDGVLGQACNIIKDALYIALLRGSDRLKVDDLAQAAEGSTVAYDSGRVNPFIHGLSPAKRLPTRR